ncbi:fatty acid CoA ligase family protein [Candidatus Mycolicibacterium alkanivorans]|uniref:AMP-binding protein n=1 Tax=Candidatus Mycolicibacterium alkanivorans TaxID=2954114 RepID=A0ABS9YQF5_9MYCO|nr:fatty acid CoA ligase family protein [Candidatus Mycolicibacterium alkanivorans]MCI4673506.1 AMP-binding protein [Candidatus Mycolicibacterium alkanivorans]
MVLFADDIFNLADIVLRVAREDPERIAVIDLDGWEGYGTRRYKRHTYAELSADVESVAVGLREMGIAELTRIVCMSPPSYQTCVVGVALTRVGAFSIWIDPAVGYRNVAERLSRVQPEAFLGNALAHLGRITFGWGPRDLRKLVLTESPLAPGGRIITGFPPFPGARSISSLRKHAPAEPQPPQVGPDDPCAVLYTTGSTGPAKPSLYLHRNFCQLFRNAHHSWRWDPDHDVPVDMAVFPAFLFIPISAGGTMVVPPIDFARQSPATVDPAALIQVINDCKVGSFFAAPILIENLAREALARNLTMPSLKRVIGAGAPISGPVERMLRAVMAPDGELAANYGATEAMPSTEIGSHEHLDGLWDLTEQGAGVCVGYALPGVELKIIDIVDGPVDAIEETSELPTGHVGEILVRGKHVSPEYYLDPEATRKNKVPDPQGDWHRFGDVGYLDAQARLWVCGRVSQRVKAVGGNVFPLQVEPLFDAHPKVRRSGLVGVPGPAGELPVLCVEVEPDVGKHELAGLHQELVARAADSDMANTIHAILFKRRLPVDPRHDSKIERGQLAKWAARQLSGPRFRSRRARPVA